MANKIEWSGSTIKIEQDRKPKKISGTKFASIFHLNPYSTDFAVWADITHTYEEPFKETKYTNAGKVIEPKQAEYMKKFYKNVITPADVFGEDAFNKTHGNFFSDDTCFGGMWDYLLKDENGNTTGVFEMKTTSVKNKNKWLDGPPIYYLLQMCLYAYLLKVNKMILVATFLSNEDYDNPSDFICDEHNTVRYEYNLAVLYPNFEETHITRAIDWWNQHVIAGVSPEFDLKKDKDILEYIHTHTNDVLSSLPKNCVILSNPSFNKSIVGITVDNCVVYDYNKMVNEYTEEFKCSEIEAKNFINNDTLVALKYIDEHKRPIIMEMISK